MLSIDNIISVISKQQIKNMRNKKALELSEIITVLFVQYIFLIIITILSSADYMTVILYIVKYIAIKFLKYSFVISIEV